jgi:hypothetical protein
VPLHRNCDGNNDTHKKIKHKKGYKQKEEGKGMKGNKE